MDQFIDDEVSIKSAFGEEFAEFEGIEVDHIDDPYR